MLGMDQGRVPWEHIYTAIKERYTPLGTYMKAID